MPFFSVILPTYNRAPFLKTTIESVLKQHFEDFEIILIDDGSTDNTEDVVQSLGEQHICYIKKANGERGAARNSGIRKANGKYVTFLDSDDRFYASHLLEAHRFIVAQNYPTVFHQGYEIKNENGRTVRQLKNVKDINRTILRGNDLSCAGIFVKREFVLENLFNEDRELATLEDWELWIRMASKKSCSLRITRSPAV